MQFFLQNSYSDFAELYFGNALETDISYHIDVFLKWF